MSSTVQITSNHIPSIPSIPSMSMRCHQQFKTVKNSSNKNNPLQNKIRSSFTKHTEKKLSNSSECRQLHE